MNKRIKVLVTSLETDENAWRGMEQKLKELYETSEKKYDLVDDPDEADIILIGDFRDGNWGEKIFQNPLLQKYHSKSFCISHQDWPLFLIHGIYANANKAQPIQWQRSRAGSYMLYPEKFKNQYIENHEYQKNHSLKKKYLFSFAGRNVHPVRDKIFNMQFHRSDIRIVDTSQTFNLWSAEGSSLDKQKSYFELLLQSKFSLCPRGCAPNSIRLFESLQLGISPVIISDAWKLPKGPHWEKFSIIIKEKYILELEKIIESHEEKYIEMGSLARKCFDKFFSDGSYFNYVVDNCIDIQRKQIIPEVLYWKFNRLYILYLKLRLKGEHHSTI